MGLMGRQITHGQEITQITSGHHKEDLWRGPESPLMGLTGLLGLKGL